MLLLSNTTRNFLDKYQEKKDFPSSPTLLHCLFHHCSWGCLWAALRTLKSTSVARNEMMKLATVQTYPYFSLMTWLIFLQSAQIRDCLPPFSCTVVTADVYSLAVPGNGKKLTCRKTAEMNTDEIWKCNFPSVNQLLKVEPHHQHGVRSPSSPGSIRWGTRPPASGI